MGSSLSTKKVLAKQAPKRARNNPTTSSLPAETEGFGVPYTELIAKDDSAAFPLDGRELGNVTDDELLSLFETAPVIFLFGGCKIVRLSKSLVMKGGAHVKPSEAETMKFAITALDLPAPRVHRTFCHILPGEPMDVDACFIIMDYICGPTVEQCWATFDQVKKESVAVQVVNIIEKMQTMPLEDAILGPIGSRGDELFQGPWFTDFGAGPFKTLQDLEAWCNHKLDVCLRFQMAPANTPRFTFADAVLTHQDIAPRNLICDSSGKVWLLDWGYAGVYPRGFEQAVLERQARNKEFSDMVLRRLSDRQEKLSTQRLNIAYGLTTGALL